MSVRLLAAETLWPAAMAQNLVGIYPHELQFPFELGKESSCVVCMINNSNEYVAFKVKATCAVRYDINPNTGVIPPRKARELTITMQAFRFVPDNMQLRDKFLVQTVVVPYGTSDRQLVPALFSKENGRYEETKLTVVLVGNHTEDKDAAKDDPAPLVTEDVQNLKSKLNNLESKLEEIEKMITRLREETTSTRGMGFQLLFVVFVVLVALVCISLGFLLRPAAGMLLMWQENCVRGTIVFY